MKMTDTVSQNTVITGKLELLSQILEHWVQIETYSIKEYDLLATQTTNPHAKTLFKRLSSEGARHAKILRIIKEMLTETGEIDLSIDISIHVTLPKDTKSHKYATDIETTYHAMKSHLKLEQGLQKTYEEITGKIKDPRAIAMFHGLAKDEKSHHTELLMIIEMFEKTFKDILKNQETSIRQQ